MKVSTTAERLKTIMQERNLKQVDILNACKPFSEKYHIKVAKNDLSQYISGKVEPKQDKLSILSRALNVNEVWLMGYDVSSNMHGWEKNSQTIQPQAGDKSSHLQDRHTTAVRIPVLGDVAAGIPISAIEDIIDWEEITEQLASTGEFFGLRIQGDSMAPRICDGDVVIVRQQSDAETGDIVIVRVDHERATCKRLRKYADGAVELISLNPSYEPMFFAKEELDDDYVVIVGVVVELRGKL